MNPQDLQNKITDLHGDILDKNDHLTDLDNMLTVSMWLTFLLYLAFALSLYVGDIWHLQTLLTSFAGGSFGMLFFGIIALLLAYMLAGTKHAAYKHFSMFPTVKIVVMLAMLTGIAAEVFNSSGVQDIKARAVTDSSSEYSSLVKSNTGTEISISPALANNIARAEQQLARCKYNVVNGKEKHCRGDQAKLDGLKKSQQSALNAQIEASTAGQAARFDRMDTLKDDSYNPVIKSISSSLAIDIASAVALVMLVFAIVFECMHYYLAVMRRDITHLLKSMREMIRRAKSDYYALTGRLYDDESESEPTHETATESRQDSEPTNLTEQPTRFKWQGKPTSEPMLKAAVAAPSTASLADEKTLSIAQESNTPKGDIEPSIKTEETTPQEIPAPERKKSGIGFTADLSAKQPAQAAANNAVTNTGGNNVSAINGATTQAKHADSNTKKPQAKHAAIGATDAPSNTQDNLRVLRARTQDHAEHAESKHAENTQKPDGKHADPDALFKAFIAALKSHEIKPTVRQSRTFVQRRIAANQKAKETPTLVQCGKIANLLIRKATAKGVLIKNPKKGNNQPNTILNGDA